MKRIGVAMMGAVAALGLAVTSLGGVAGASSLRPATHHSMHAVVRVTGVITSVTAGTPETISVLVGSSKQTVTVQLGVNTVVLAQSQPSTAAALVVGDRISLVATGSPLTASLINSFGPVVVHLAGSVTTVATSSGAVTGFTVLAEGSHATVSVAVSPQTIFRQAGVVVTSAVLLQGSQVNVTAVGSPLTASLVSVAPPKPTVVTGFVSSLVPSTGTPTQVVVQPFDLAKSPVTIALTGSTTFVMGGQSSSVSSLQVNSRVTVTAVGSPLSATRVFISAARVVEDGVVTAASPTSITIQPSMSNPVTETFALAPTVVYREGGKVVTSSAVAIGDVVEMTAPAATPGTATLVRVLNTALIGRVTAMNGAVLTVLSHNTLVTITTTPTTIFRKAGRLSSVMAIHVGTFIVAVGPATPATPSALTAQKVFIGRDDNPGLEHWRWY